MKKMTSSQKPHSVSHKRNASGLHKQKPKQPINQAELSSAVALLSGDAVAQACALLMAQSRELFGAATEEHNGGESQAKPSESNAAVSGSVKSEENSSESDSTDKPSEIATQTKRAPHDYTKQLLALYHKCNRAHDLILQANELGQLDRPSGMNSVPSSPHLNLSTTTPRSAHATPGVVVNSMPPPPPSLSGSNMPVSSLDRRNISGATSLGGNNRLYLRRKPSDVATAHATPKSQRVNSTTGDHSTQHTSTTALQNNPNPPEAVLNFLKKLNANGAAEDGGDASVPSRVSVPVSASIIRDNKKRKATSPPPNPPPSAQVKRLVPPPPAAATPDLTQAALPEDKPGRRSARSSALKKSTSSITKIHGVGEAVMVRDKNIWYDAIVKDVNCEEGEDVTYEVEFDNGEIQTGVLPINMRDGEDD